LVIAGHVSRKMLERYSHVRLAAKRAALGAIGGMSHVTKMTQEAKSDSGYDSQVVEKFGGADGIRTHDLLDAIEARSQLRHSPTGRTSQC
jgi:hypothetical protein